MKRNSNDLTAFFFAFVLFLVLVVCALSSCAGWPATYKAGVRRVAEDRLVWCIRSHPCGLSYVCYASTRAFCKSKGLESTCGENFPDVPRCSP